MTKRLYRSRTEKMIGGVAGGIAEYFEIDPVFIRIEFVLLLFLSGVGLLAYILLWILVPKSPVGAPWTMPGAQPSGAPAGAGYPGGGFPGGGLPGAEFPGANYQGASMSMGTAPVGGESAVPADDPDALRRSARRQSTGGMILIALGVLFLANNLIPAFDLGDFWPLLFIAGGAWMLYRSSESHS